MAIPNHVRGSIVTIVRRAARSILKYGALGELSRMRRSEIASPIAAAFDSALRHPDQSTVADLAAIERIRSQLNRSGDVIEMHDFGAGPRGRLGGDKAREGAVVERNLSELSTDSSADPFWARLLHELVRQLRPSVCLEMGGLVGISTAYQAAALRRNRTDGRRGELICLEGDPTLSGIIQSNLDGLGLGDLVTVVTGRFDETLGRVAGDHAPIDFAFVDGHHAFEPTLRYFEALRPHLADGAVVVFDDIAWSPGMRSAWRAIVAQPGIAVAIATGQFGIVRLAAAGAGSGETNGTLVLEKYAIRLV